MSLAPEIIKQLADQKAAGLPQVWEAPLPVIRELTQSRVAFAGEPEPIHSVVNRFIPGPTSDLPIRIYRPNSDQSAPALPSCSSALEKPDARGRAPAVA